MLGNSKFITCGNSGISNPLAGAKGEAISLVCIDEKQYLKDIEKLVNLRIPSKIKQGFEPDPNAVPEPAKQKNRNNFNRNKGRSNRNRNNYRK